MWIDTHCHLDGEEFDVDRDVVIQRAREAGVGQLLLGHYSSRYEDEQVLLKEAQEVFENTRLTDENAIFDV